MYGSLLSPSCRFFDQRIGQSTTLSGRQVVKHMISSVNEIITGEYDHVGDAVIYSDTDSVYFSAYNTLKNDISSGKIKWDKDSVIELYDQIGNIVNGTFIDFMLKTFHCPKERGSVIRAGRELVALKGLYITKKRYAVLYFDKEGKRTDINNKPGKVKAMGLDLRRADTPEFMQDFLNEILLMVLTNEPQDAVLTRITEFRNEFKQRPGWEKGTPKRVNNLTAFKDKEAIKKTNMPGHVRASINWNTLRKLFDDKYSMAITDGQKTIVCKLKNNSLGMTSVAYPIDELRVPQWFKELPFDHEAMEQIIIDHKIDNLIGVLNYDLESTRTANSFNDLFDFE